MIQTKKRDNFVSPEPSRLEIRYHHYLQHSWRWYIIRSVRRWADERRCQTCHSTKGIQVHHASYSNLRMHWGAWILIWSLIKEFFDTICLCERCHSRIHH